MSILSLLEFAAKMEAAALDMHDAEQAIVAEVALRIYEEARLVAISSG